MTALQSQLRDVAFGIPLVALLFVPGAFLSCVVPRLHARRLVVCTRCSANCTPSREERHKLPSQSRKPTRKTISQHTHIIIMLLRFACVCAGGSVVIVGLLKLAKCFGWELLPTAFRDDTTAADASEARLRLEELKAKQHDDGKDKT